MYLNVIEILIFITLRDNLNAFYKDYSVYRVKLYYSVFFFRLHYIYFNNFSNVKIFSSDI